MISHIFLGTNEPTRATAFYAPLMEALGWRRRHSETLTHLVIWNPAETSRPLFVLGRPFDGQDADPGNEGMVALLAPDRPTVAGAHPPLEWVTAWITRILRPIPGLAWIPFAILWFGVEEKAAVFIIAIGVFWIVYFSAHGAIRNVDRDLVEVAAAFGFRTGWEKLVKVQFPASLPGILVGVRTSLGQAWMAVVAAELFGVAGLGQRMNQASSLLATDIVVVYMLTMAALYGLIDMAFIFAQSRLLTWKA